MERKRLPELDVRMKIGMRMQMKVDESEEK